MAVQSSPQNWGLDRIDAVKGFDSKYNYAYTGAGVHVYVLDTPMTNHPKEFGNRLVECISFTSEACSVAATNPHASHVAGTYKVGLLLVFCMAMFEY
jgi:subtilisin family serine protease